MNKTIEAIPDVVREYLMLDTHEATPNIPIIAGDLVPDPPDQMAIFLNGTTNVVAYFGSSGNTSSPLIVILVRATTYGVGLSNAQIARELLSQKVSVDNVDIVPASDVIYLGRNEQHLHLFRTNYKTIIKE